MDSYSAYTAILTTNKPDSTRANPGSSMATFTDNCAFNDLFGYAGRNVYNFEMHVRACAGDGSLAKQGSNNSERGKTPVNQSAVIIFDLDGTLTEPQFDFDAIRSEIGVSGPILEALPGLSADRRVEVETVLARHERQAARQSILRDGAVEVLQACKERGFSTAILTRNSRESLNTVLTRHALTVDTTRTRDDGAIKPSAEPVLSICEELGASPKRSWMVGDYLFDVLSGKAAGSRTVLLVDGRELPSFADKADFVIRKLVELLGIIDAGGRG